MECIRLRVKDIDFERDELTVRDGKGMKDRVTMLPKRVKEHLRKHLETVRQAHEEDLAAGCGEVLFRFFSNETDDLFLVRRPGPGCRTRVIHSLRLRENGHKTRRSGGGGCG